MQNQLQVSFRNLDYSPAIATAVRKRAAELEKFYPRITSVRVLIEPSGRKHHQGNLYRIRINVTIPGHEFAVTRDPSENHAHEDMYVAIRDAFLAARRQLEDLVRTHYHGRVKQRSNSSHGSVLRLFPNEDYGFLESEDGEEVYFHRNSVLRKGFDKLRVGDKVRFVEEQGDKGPQASTVDPSRRRVRAARASVA